MTWLEEASPSTPSDNYGRTWHQNHVKRQVEPKSSECSPFLYPIVLFSENSYHARIVHCLTNRSVLKVACSEIQIYSDIWTDLLQIVENASCGALSHHGRNFLVTDSFPGPLFYDTHPLHQLYTFLHDSFFNLEVNRSLNLELLSLKWHIFNKLYSSLFILTLKGETFVSCIITHAIKRKHCLKLTKRLLAVPNVFPSQRFCHLVIMAFSDDV